MEKIDQPIQTILDVIVSDKFTGLDAIMRFNGMPVHKAESVSQHSFWVATIAAILLENTFTPNIDKRLQILDFKHRVITYCLFHDLEETTTGDVLFPLKYNNYNGSKIRECLNDFIQRENIKSFQGSEILKTIYCLIPDEDDAVEEKILIKICDWLSCIKYVHQEISMGNYRMLEMLTLCEEHLLQRIDAFIPLMYASFGSTFKVDTYLNIKQQIQHNERSVQTAK